MMIDDNGYVGNRDNFWLQIFINSWQQKHMGQKKGAVLIFKPTAAAVPREVVICHNLCSQSMAQL